MRILIVAALLFFNVAFALWMVYGDGPRPRTDAVPATDSGVASLRLLSEPPDTAGSAAPPPASAPMPQPGESPSAPVAASAPPPDRPDPATPAAPDVVPQDPPQCRAVGPYADRRVAGAEAERLAGQGVEARVVEAPVNEVRYWVYLPPFASRSAAFEGERELRAKGIEDIQVLAGDEKQNGISLGLFRDQSAAARRLDQLRGLGYAPQMEPIERSRSNFWIETPSPAAGDSTTPAWLEPLIAAGRRVEVRPCDDSAQP